MTNAIPSTVARVVRDRSALLWVCQRYDLLPGEEPHDYNLPAAEAALRYRTETTQTDLSLAAHYWEAVWLEGANSPMLTAIRQTAGKQPTHLRRSVVVLAGEADTHARVSSQEFLPICVLPGLLDTEIPPGMQYGSVRAKARERLAWDLATRLEAYPRRVLIVLGAQDENDLQRLYDVVEDCPLTDLHLLLVWPEGVAAPSVPVNPAIRLIIWTGSADQFSAALTECGAPSAEDLSKWAVRIGKQLVELPARDVDRVRNRFMLLTDRDLLPPQKFDMDDLQDFLEGNLDKWAAYGAGLPVPRSYASGEGRSLTEEIQNALDLLEREGDKFRTFVLQLPCEGGAGATTMLRAAAFQAATEGHPTLFLRPDQVDIDLEDLLAFATSLSESALAAEVEDIPPMIIVLDVEHANISRARHLPQVLAAHGRRALIVQAIPRDDTTSREQRRQRWARLQPLVAEARPEEVTRCAEEFKRLVAQWHLTLVVPSVEQWQSYKSATRWTTPSGQGQVTSMFWVALRFFLTEELDLTAASRAMDALGKWIERRAAKVTDSRMVNVLRFIAALSAFRIVSPLWTVLRPVTGGSFSSELAEVIREIKDIVVWESSSEDLDDHVLRFAHPALAEEYLRQQGVNTTAEKVKVLTPVLQTLSTGHPGDMWMIESLATTVMAPRFEERESPDWDWRLDAFNKIPPVVREQSKTILHHWARCLYQSADSRNSPTLPTKERRARLETAIGKLKKATEIPRRPDRDEHPSHLYNTLGTAYFRYAKFLEETGAPGDEVSQAWDKACQAFEQSIKLSEGINVEALLAFSNRLLTHAKANDVGSGTASENSTHEVAYALSLLDEVEEILELYPNPDPEWESKVVEYRSLGLSWLNNSAGYEYVRQLQDSGAPELGYYCEARLVLMKDSGDKDGLKRALDVLKKAEDRGVKLGHYSLRLRLSLLRRHDTECYNFPLLRRLHQALENSSEYTPRPIDLFRHAVLCYQTGDFNEGKERFRRLREQRQRSGNPPLIIRDVWRDANDPTRPRVTQIRVTRYTTEWRAEGYIDDLKQTVPLKPRHFSPPPREREIVSCVIRFESNGPLAVPLRFEEGGEYHFHRRPAEKR